MNMDPSRPVRRKPANLRSAKYLLSAALPVLAASTIMLAAVHGPRSFASIAAAQTSDQSANQKGTSQNNRNPSALLEAYRHVEVASVSDAMEQLLGKRMYLSHRMRPVGSARFAGYAVTVRMEKQENHDAHAVDGMLEAIDRGEKNSVYVMSVEDGADVAGMGGLMGTAMAAREFSGAIIDAAVRDTAYLRKIGFPVYATGIAPSTLVGHYKCAGTQVPVNIDGVTIRPGDLIAADDDGIVVVPVDRAADILNLAQQLDFKEHSMYPLIEKTKSIEDAVKQFGRL
jgi:regulator of RNase E activity RraA